MDVDKYSKIAGTKTYKTINFEPISQKVIKSKREWKKKCPKKRVLV